MLALNHVFVKTFCLQGLKFSYYLLVIKFAFIFRIRRDYRGGQGGNSNQLLEVSIGQFQILIDNPGKEQ